MIAVLFVVWTAVFLVCAWVGGGSSVMLLLRVIGATIVIGGTIEWLLRRRGKR